MGLISNIEDAVARQHPQKLPLSLAPKTNVSGTRGGNKLLVMKLDLNVRALLW